VDLAVVYSREIDGRQLTLAPSGWTYRHTFVLYDRESMILWYPFEEGLMGIQGRYFKHWLKKVPSEDTYWRIWRKKHPESPILR